MFLRNGVRIDKFACFVNSLVFVNKNAHDVRARKLLIVVIYIVRYLMISNYFLFLFLQYRWEAIAASRRAACKSFFAHIGINLARAASV